MRKLFLGIILLLLAGLISIAGTLYRYPYLPAIVDEGFPPPFWPAKGIYVDVSGQPKVINGDIASYANPVSEAGGKLNALLKDSETDALLAYHKGQLRYAYFRPGVDMETRFNSYSMAKSLIGYLVLKAIEDGEIDGLDSPIGDYLLTLEDKRLAALPIERFLTMKSGLLFEKKSPPKPLARDAKREPDKDASNPFTPLARLHIEGLASVADQLKLPEKPDFTYHYQNVNTALLGAMLTAIYKQPLNEILSAKLWKPSGAFHAKWRTYTHDGAVTPYCCLYARAEDWARVGIFLSRNGAKGAPFLSAERLVLVQPGQYSRAALRDGVYGLHIRHDILDRAGEPLQGPFTYFVGHKGQLVYMKPEDDLVVVRFGRRHTLLHSTLYYVWREIMARAAKGANKENAGGFEKASHPE